LAIGCLTIIVLLVVVFGGGYVAYSTGALSQSQILYMIGQGYPRIEVENFTDAPINADFKPVYNGKPSIAGWSTFLNPFDIRYQTLTGPGRYDFIFSNLGRKQIFGTCHATLGGGERLQFVVLPGRVVVNNPDNPPSNGAELIVGTSSLCR
jgi:hypothetical protein